MARCRMRFTKRLGFFLTMPCRLVALGGRRCGAVGAVRVISTAMRALIKCRNEQASQSVYLFPLVVRADLSGRGDVSEAPAEPAQL